MSAAGRQRLWNREKAEKAGIKAEDADRYTIGATIAIPLSDVSPGFKRWRGASMTVTAVDYAKGSITLAGRAKRGKKLAPGEHVTGYGNWAVVKVHDNGSRLPVRRNLSADAAERLAGHLRDGSTEAEIAGGWNYLAVNGAKNSVRAKGKTQ